MLSYSKSEALFTTASMRPKARATAGTRASQAASSARSAAKAMARPPASCTALTVCAASAAEWR